MASAQGEDDEVMGEGESVTMGGGGEEEEEEDMEVEDEEEDEPVKAPDVVSIVGCNFCNVHCSGFNNNRVPQSGPSLNGGVCAIGTSPYLSC